MGYDAIRIEREREGFCVRVTDPEIIKSNRERERSNSIESGSWRDPNVEYKFETKEQVLAFVEKAIDIALPADDYSSAFDKLAKEVQKP
jgi:hypothetical protein